MCFFSIFLLILKNVFKDKLQDWGFAMNRKDIDVDEGLPNFFEAVKLTASDELCEENKNMMDNFEFEFSDPDTIETLQAA
jgi:hypothetical protein